MTPKRNIKNFRGDEGGFVLIGALLILMLLVVIGISATTNTSLELQIAGNDRTHKETFYQADGGSQFAARLIEESLGTPGGFSALNSSVLIDPTDATNKTVLIVDTTLSENEDTTRDHKSVSDAGRDVAYFPNGYDATLPDPNVIPHTNIIADGLTTVLAGSGLQMLAGYEGKGKGTAGGGGQIQYNIFSQHIGRSNSEAVVAIQWQHIIGLELEGKY